MDRGALLKSGVKRVDRFANCLARFGEEAFNVGFRKVEFLAALVIDPNSSVAPMRELRVNSNLEIVESNDSLLNQSAGLAKNIKVKKSFAQSAGCVQLDCFLLI